MTPELYTWVRWLHVVCASAWFGEIIVINFILIPALSSYHGASRKDFLNVIFPKIFNLASILSAATIITGVTLLYHFIGYDLSQLLKRGAWGYSIMIGGVLGLILTFFHFFIEKLLSKKIGSDNPHITHDEVEDIHLKLKIIPRIGMMVITIIFLLMLNTTHQLIDF